MNAGELGFPANSFDIAFSSQLIEHLYTEDVEFHFASVYRVLSERVAYCASGSECAPSTSLATSSRTSALSLRQQATRDLG